MPITAKTLERFLLPSKVFVETGSAGGAGIAAALEAGFTEVYSADVAEQCVVDCLRRFTGDDRVEVYLADTVSFLEELVPALPNPCVFWLDAHPDHDSPILKELEVLQKAPCRSHTLLIDDRRLMQGHWRSVREPQVHDALRRVNPDYRIIYVDGYEPDDIIAAVEYGTI